MPPTRTREPRFPASGGVQSGWTTVAHRFPGNAKRNSNVARTNRDDVSGDDISNMNSDLVERFGRSRLGVEPRDDAHAGTPQPQRVNHKVREYYEATKVKVEGEPWQSRPELPSSAEVLDLPENEGEDDGDVVLIPNMPNGAWQSKSHYLKAHYELLREDAVRPLREAIGQLKVKSHSKEEDYRGTVGIYEKVFIVGVILSPKGVAVRVVFSMVRAGKKIHWEQSKRLLTGSVVVLTPANDMFQTKAVVAVVAARPLAAVQQNPPEIDLFFARPEELELDPSQEWVMLEERTGYYEAERHTLLALQKMMKESFPLSEHLVHAQNDVGPPGYVSYKPHTDISFVFCSPTSGNAPSDISSKYENVDILNDWPVGPASELDASQLAALRRILTKRLAIVQGPPGTGKTHVSVVALKTMINNMVEDDPPIIVTCQTNHALDQLLRHVASFEPNFVRLGGRSKDRDVIKKRTLYEVRMQHVVNPVHGGLRGSAIKKMKDLDKNMALLLAPLETGMGTIGAALLEKCGLLTAEQYASLNAGAALWVQQGTTAEQHGPMELWLGDALVRVERKQQPEEFDYEFEEADLEFEQLKEAEAENFSKDDEEFDELKGRVINIAENFTERKTAGVTEKRAKTLLEQNKDLWKIPPNLRGAVYCYLQRQTKIELTKQLRQLAVIYQENAEKRRFGGWESDVNLLQQQKVIGLTTTGFSKFRALISALSPKVVLIEEAAETLEAPVIATCMESIEHLILVGDHQQLRPHCHVKDLENKPYYLNISLFERMVNNKVEFTTLSRQRRMIPEIRRALYPIYQDRIEDHPSVSDPAVRPPVPGMGGINSFFFLHEWPESRDDYMSSVNFQEAHMIAAFFDYLVYNGLSIKDITVLTFYNGQRKILLGLLRSNPRFSGELFNVVTVDSYQGEENKVVLLSLVRSNSENKIGFLDVDNRVCVALSRAQCGFYIFGNAELLYHTSKTWRGVINIMANKHKKTEAVTKKMARPKERLDDKLPVTCQTHGNRTLIERKLILR
ncbi:hypothetical protein LTR66_011920 [Elasticomyces elasticus]|nr:hypothetical protein LTR66_011920 [Elasticomyces elasticus]